MAISQLSCEKFIDETFSKAPVPGGGGVAAMAGAMGAALAGMVCNLTLGKKKYAKYENDILRIVEETEKLKNELLSLVDKDAENFLPLSAVYSMPSGTEEEKKLKDKKMQSALLTAVSAPIDMIKIAYKAAKLHSELLDKGSVLAVSDVGCGADCIRTAMRCAWLNVKINLKSISDKAYVSSVCAELEPMLSEGIRLCDDIYEKVSARLS